MLAICRCLPVAAEAVDELCILLLLLPVEILELPVNLDNARKIRPVLGAELRRFLLEVAPARMDLPKSGRGKTAVLFLQAGICGDHPLRVALRRGAVLGLGQDAVGRGGNKLTAELVDLQRGRVVLGLAGLCAGGSLRRGHNAMGGLELRQALFVGVDAGLQLPELAVEPGGRFRGRFDLALAVLLLIGADQSIDDCGRERSVARAEANLDKKRPRHRLHAQAAAEAVEKPGLRCRRGRIGTESGKTAGEISAESRRLVQAKAGDNPPGKLVAAQLAGNGFKFERSTEQRGRRQRVRRTESQRGGRSGAQLDFTAGLILIGRNYTVDKTEKQQPAFNQKDQAAAHDKKPPELRQGNAAAAPAHSRR